MSVFFVKKLSSQSYTYYMIEYRNKHKRYGSFKPLFRLALESVVDIWVTRNPHKCQTKRGLW